MTTTRAHYDAWHNLLTLIGPVEGEDWPTLQPTDNPCILIVRYPDGSEGEVVYKSGRWVFASELQAVGFGYPGN